MEQNIGSVGNATETYSKGVASAVATVAVPQTSYGLTLKVSAEADLDAKVLVAYLAAKIGGPVPAEVAAFIELALGAT